MAMIWVEIMNKEYMMKKLTMLFLAAIAATGSAFAVETTDATTPVAVEVCVATAEVECPEVELVDTAAE